MSQPHTRRAFIARCAHTAVGLAAGTALTACGDDDPTIPFRSGEAARSRLAARPIAAPPVPRGALAPGLRTLLAADTGPEVLLYVPPGHTPTRAAPLAVALHGAGQTNRSALAPLQPFADALGLLLVAPQASGTTWDFLYGPYGVDVRTLDRALTALFRDADVDASRIALTGFSDGASYALSLGLGNGDLFTRLVAFSPGVLAPAERRGQPSIFLSHGTADPVLHIDRTSRRFAPLLRDAGYDVTFREFDGGHAVPAPIAEAAARFVTA